ncbi:MAG TPA: glycosyltransferase family 4 protein [Chloroflexia bacterium]|nr:glycosyltransferase family 4 protein [Chloroflexia bacterium]
MKLAIVIPGFQSDERDWCIPVFTNLARCLSRQVELHVFALRYPQRRDYYRIGEVNVHSTGAGAFGDRRIWGLSLLKTWRDFEYDLSREHQAAPFDAIMGIWATESGMLATSIARKLGVPSLVHLAGGELVDMRQVLYGNYGRPFEGHFVRASLRDADLITAPSGVLVRRLKRIRADMRKVRRWAPGVDTAMFSPGEAERPQRPFTFVTVASLLPVKGHRMLIRAFSNLRGKVPDRPLRWLVVGGGRLRSALVDTVGSIRRLKGYVDFLGEVSHDRLPELYRATDAFVLGSLHEAQCMALLEAMSCGVPWVGPPVGAAYDLARLDTDETPTGVAFAARKPDLVGDALLRMLQMDPDARSEWGAQARRRVLRDYELQEQTDRLVGLLRELTG